MTSRIREANRSRTLLRHGVLGLTTLALSAGLFCGPAGVASADPALTVADAKAQVIQLETEAAAVDQEYAGVKEQVDTGRVELTTKQNDVKAQTAKVATMRHEVGQVALAQFQNRDLDTTAQLFLTNDTDGFLSQMSTVEKVSENQNRVLQTFQSEQSDLADLERSATSSLATLTTQEKALVGLRAESEAKIAESKAVLARLTAEERQRIADEEKAAAAAAKRAAEKVDTAARDEATSRSSDRPDTGSDSTDAERDNGTTSGERRQSTTPSERAQGTAPTERTQNTTPSERTASTKPTERTQNTTPSNTTPSNTTRPKSSERSQGTTARKSTDRTTPPESTSARTDSSKGATAVAFAKQQVGKPYRYGATGPGAYDCSGLTGAAWKAAGVSLTRTSQQQIGSGTSVTKADLQPGDLVFYYPGITHVALYVGNGQIVHASRPGKPVGYASVDSMPFAGARRPG